MIPEGLGHRWGECLTHDESRTCFLNIPKCASTSMKIVLGDVGFVHQWQGGWVKPPGWFTFGIWRHHTDRLLSGLSEAKRRGITHRDEHTIPQAEFLYPSNPVDEWVSFDTFTADVPRLLAARGVVLGSIPWENATDVKAPA